MELNDTSNKIGIAGEFLLALVITLFSLFVIMESIRMPMRGHLGIVMSPGFVPLFTGLVLFFLSMFIVIRSAREHGPAFIGFFLNFVRTDEENRRFLVILTLFTLYVIGLVGRVPFYVSTAVYLFLTFAYLKAGSGVKILIYTIVGTLLVSVVLPFVFEMPLP